MSPSARCLELSLSGKNTVLTEHLCSYVHLGTMIKLPTGDRLIRGRLLNGTFDAPAKGLLQNFVQYNGFYGCPNCEAVGKWVKTSERAGRMSPLSRHPLRLQPYVTSISVVVPPSCNTTRWSTFDSQGNSLPMHTRQKLTQWSNNKTENSNLLCSCKTKINQPVQPFCIYTFASLICILL